MCTIVLSSQNTKIDHTDFVFLKISLNIPKAVSRTIRNMIMKTFLLNNIYIPISVTLDAKHHNFLKGIFTYLKQG